MGALGRIYRRIRFRLLLPSKHIRAMGLVAAQMSINPIELLALISFCITGLVYVFGVPVPSSVRATLPGWAIVLWAANLGLGALAALVGGMQSKQLAKGLLLYQIGWGLAGTSSLVYGLALTASFPITGAYAYIWNFCIAFAAFVRVLQVQRFFTISNQILVARIADIAQERERQVGHG